MAGDTLRGQQAKLRIYLENSDSTTNFDAMQVKTRLSKIKDLWSEYFDAEMQIESMQEDEGVEAEDDSFEENYFNSVTRAQKMLKAHSSQVPEQADSRNSVNLSLTYPLKRRFLSKQIRGIQ
ncbi:hypothetical protein QE152_g71 [Popillia japonica]|uniref:Uncharacterized protein n=1 Tax=Popillia japonica TaxID=7064 RepID=A0AAW1NL36_POPJA